MNYTERLIKQKCIYKEALVLAECPTPKIIALFSWVHKTRPIEGKNSLHHNLLSQCAYVYNLCNINP